MTVKELFQSLEFDAIADALKRKPYKSSLLPMSEYKDNYDIICSLDYSVKGGTITFKADGDSDVYMIEGGSFKNIIGKEVIFSDPSEMTKINAAADIIWSASPFGRWTDEDWRIFEEELLNPLPANEYKLRAKQIKLIIDLPYCRDKSIRRELKREIKSPYEDPGLSLKAWKWLSDADRRRNIKHNRSKRKREYRLRNRYEKLLKFC